MFGRRRPVPGGKPSVPVAIMVAFALLALLVLLSGCGKGGESQPRSPTEEADESGEVREERAAVEETKAEGEEAPEAVEGFGYEDASGGTEEVMVLKDIRFGDHGTYERAVLEFASQAYYPRSGIPRFTVRYRPSPYVDEEGNSVDLGGPFLLEVRFNANKADLSHPEGEIVMVYTGPDEFSPGLSIISQARLVPAYEHNSMVLLIGLGERVPYRVQEMLGPPRIVIDVSKR